MSMSIYPKLRPDAYITESPEGVAVVVDGKVTHLKGGHLAALLERLLPHLDGTHAMEEFTASLPEAKGRIVRQLLETLLRLSALRDVAEDREYARALDPALARTYAASLGYLEALGEGAVRRFLQLRSARVAVMGRGAAVRTLAAGLWEAGVRQGVVMMPPSDAHVAPLEQLLAEHRAVDAELDWHIDRVHPQGGAAMAMPEGGLRECRLVVAVGSAEELGPVNEQCLAAGVPLLPVVLARGFGFIGPFVRPELPGCLACALVRVQPVAPERPPENMGWSFLGARAAVEAFKALAGLPAVCEQALIRIDGEELTDSVHVLHRVGDCSACARMEASPSVAVPRLGVAPVEVSPESTEKWVDPFSGLLTSMDPEDWPQLPLCLWAARGRSSQGEVWLAPGKDHDSARLRCVLGGMMAALPESPGAQASCLLVSGEALAEATPMKAPVTGVSWCRSAGYHLEEWIGQGVLSLAQQEVDPMRQGARLSTDVLASMLDEESAFWWKTLGLRYDLDAEAWLVKSPVLPVFTVQVCSRETPLARASGRSGPEALKTALLAALGSVQADPSAGAQGEDRFHLGARATALRVEASTVEPAQTWKEWLPRLSGYRLYLALDPRNAPLQIGGLYLGWIGLERGWLG